MPPERNAGLWLPRLHSVARTSDEKEHLAAGAAVVKICCAEEEDEKKQAKSLVDVGSQPRSKLWKGGDGR